MPDEKLEAYKRAYDFVKTYSRVWIDCHNKGEDIPHNEQYFLHSYADHILGKMTGTAPDETALEVNTD